VEAATPQQPSLEVHPSLRSDWTEMAMASPEEVRRGLAELGVPPDRLEPAVADYAAELKALQATPLFNPRAHYYARGHPEAYEAMVWERRRSDRERLSKRLRDVLSRQQLRVREETRIRIELPLFLLAAPPVPDSLASFETTATTTYGRGWQVIVRGTGTGRTVQTEISDVGRFSASGGERKLVFLPATLVATAVDVLERGKKVGEGCRTEVVFTEGRVRHNQAVRVLTSDAEPPGPFTETGIESFELERAGSGVTEYSRGVTDSQSGRVQLGVTAFGVGVSVEASITRDREYALSFALPSGWHYECARIAGPHVADGIRWTVDRP
jgi:hypothetical protein